MNSSTLTPVHIRPKLPHKIKKEAGFSKFDKLKTETLSSDGLLDLLSTLQFDVKSLAGCCPDPELM